MRWLSTLLFLLVVPLLFACGNEVESRLPPLSAGATILAFGDSLTYGSGTSKANSYPSVLEQLSHYRVINGGVPGDTTVGGLQRLPALLDQHQPQLLLLCLGGNDMLRHMSTTEAKENLRRMIQMARERDIAVLLLGVPRPNLLGLESAEFYSELAAEEQLPYDGDTLPELLSQRSLKSDQIHLNTEGYRLLAVAIHRQLQHYGALASP